MTLDSYRNQFNKIMNNNESSSVKDKALAVLMTDMEIEYKIPLLKNDEWEERNKETIELYREISYSRKLY